MLDPIKDALLFYTSADYLVVNAFLWKNTETLEPCLQIIHSNNIGMIKEAEQQTPEKRFAFSVLDCKALYDSYKRRTPGDLSPFSKRLMLEQAIADPPEQMQKGCLCTAIWTPALYWVMRYRETRWNCSD